ncbi:S-adenosylmethionine decarboxylase proenzyme [Leptolyngbya sp. NIES-3755]|nr:S-adenosylmethionine decarboxylase proenzyme [Leptolyngbya sp. NIES-3755]
MKKQFCSLGEVASMPIGSHCILELFGCPSTLLDDVGFIQEVVKEAVKRAKATLLKEISYQFEPFGVTALALLSESHISIHTWPESGYIAIDVFTCGEHTQPEQACLCFVEAFQASNHSLMTLHRGQFAPTIHSTIKHLEGDHLSSELEKITVKTSL